jgi:hypothetical protein
MLQDALHFGFFVECPVKVLGSRCFVRISAMVYNERACYEALAAAVLRIGWLKRDDGGVELIVGDEAAAAAAAAAAVAATVGEGTNANVAASAE